MQAATIKLFLPNGDASGIRTAEISNWTGKAIAGPRTEIDTLLKRPELDSPGVYILIGSDESGDSRIYIGEAECVKNRLKQHKEKEFWVQVMAFISKDENLTKGQKTGQKRVSLRFLEFHNPPRFKADSHCSIFG